MDNWDIQGIVDRKKGVSSDLDRIEVLGTFLTDVDYTTRRKPVTDLTRQRMSEGRKRMWKTDGFRERWMKIRWSPEQRQKQSKKYKGRHPTNYRIVEEWIAKFKTIHGDRYDYSKVKTMPGREKITIICPEHGEFEIDKWFHSRGGGCKTCSYIFRGKIGSRKLSKCQVITDFKNIHGDRYDYSKVDYQTSNTKVTIICTKHGEFDQLPAFHKRGSNCPKCASKTPS